MNLAPLKTHLLTLFLFYSVWGCSQYASVANGPFNATSTWACNCIPPDNGDLIIQHAVSFDDSLSLNNSIVEISPVGSLIGLSTFSQLQLTNTVFLMKGLVYVGRATISVSTDSIQSEISGQLTIVENLLCSGDTLHVSGTVSVGDTLILAQPMKILSGGITETGFTSSIAGIVIGKGGTLNVSQDFQGLVQNFGSVMVQGNATMYFGNYGSIEVSGNLRVDNFLVNYGSILVNGDVRVEHALPSSTASLQLNADSAILSVSGDFHQLGEISGIGSICIQGDSYNGGDVFGALDICDLSPAVSPTCFDFDIGGSISTSTTCCIDTVTSCAPLGIEGRDITQSLIHAYPNPFKESCVLSKTDPGEPLSLRLIDREGRAIFSHDWKQGKLELDLNLEPGVYFLIAMGSKKSEIVPIVKVVD